MGIHSTRFFKQVQHASVDREEEEDNEMRGADKGKNKEDSPLSRPLLPES